MSLEVTVSPSQSAFFAGELFSATITFTNPAPASSSSLNTPLNGPGGARAFSNLQPPVSAGASTSAAGSSTGQSGGPVRKGLIGRKPAPAAAAVVTRGAGGAAHGLYDGGPRRPGQATGAAAHGRTQSLAFGASSSTPDLLATLKGPAPAAAGRKQHYRNHSSAVLGLGLGELEPHPGQGQRKPSQLGQEQKQEDEDGQDEDDEEPVSPTASSDSTASPFQTFVTPHLGVQQTPRTPYSASPWSKPIAQQQQQQQFLFAPNTVLLLWSFCHLEGSFMVDDKLVKGAEFDEVKKSLLAGPGSGVGGGTLDEASAASGGAGGGGWGSWIFGGGGGADGGLASSMGPGGEAQGDARRAGATLEERKVNSMKDRRVPTFQSPPSILNVDLVLEPGESKTYSFSIRLPADLPPSFRGKSIKFSYNLVVGTSRSHLSPRTPKIGAPRTPGLGTGFKHHKGTVNKVMKVPVRVYNHVSVTGARPFYDLTNPIIYDVDSAVTSALSSSSGADAQKQPPAPRVQHYADGRREFEKYAKTLLESVALASPEEPVNQNVLSPEMNVRSPNLLDTPNPASRPEMRGRRGGGGPAAGGTGLGGGEGEEEEGCKAAVEIVSRNSQKVSYDINKDGYLVAKLTLAKQAYRLGETVNGSVVMNGHEGRVLRLSARLESHELVETSIAKLLAPQIRNITRRLHSEHHTMTLDSARVGFALAIPSNATPEFATSGVKLQWTVRLTFLVIPPSPDGPPPPPRTHGRTPSMAPPSRHQPQPSQGGGGGGGGHNRSKSFAYGFEPAVPVTLPDAPLVHQTGASHLQPLIGPGESSSTSHNFYKGVADLGFVPVLFSSASSSAAAQPAQLGPLQRQAMGHHHHQATPSRSSTPPPRPGSPMQQLSVVLVPAKVETVECSIPIKVYPGNTPFRPARTVFAA